MDNTVKNYIFFYHPRLLDYTFEPPHPYQSKRLADAIDWLKTMGLTEFVDPGVGSDKEVMTVHSLPYMKALKDASERPENYSFADRSIFGLIYDTPPYIGIYEAARDVLHASVMAATAINDGYELAFNMSGGLHHAQFDHASGFCALSDIAAAIEVLKRKHKYIAYVDIDLHHGDGPQKIYENDPDVLTVSIHQFGVAFYPGTGSVDESSSHQSIVNIPLIAGTDSKTWLNAVQEIIVPALIEFDPQVIVLQLGADAHHQDPLGQLKVVSEDWLKAVEMIGNLKKPILALGGGGYNLHQTSVLWAAAVARLIGMDVPQKLQDIFLNESCFSLETENMAATSHYEHILRRLKPIISDVGREEADDYS